MAIGERGLLVTLLGKLLFAGGIAVFAADIDIGQQHHHYYSPAGGDKETFGEFVGVTLGNAPRSHGSVTVKLARNLERSVRTRAEVPRADLPSGVARQEEAWRNVARRQLQESCANGTDISVLSTAFPDAEGCYLMTDDNMYTSPTLDRVVALVSDPDGDDAESLWVRGTVDSTSTASTASTASTSDTPFTVVVDQECFSDSFTSSVYPSDVETWYCYMDEATEATEVDEAEFSVACGCLSPAPTAVPTSSPTGFGDEESSCDETESVEITSDSAPDLEGCYEVTDAEYLYGGNYYNRTSSDGEMDLAIFPLAYADESDARWTLGADAEDTDDIAIFCYSEEVVNVTHPSDASWYCNLTGTSGFLAMTDDVFAVGCGCSSGSVRSGSVRSSPGISLYGTAAISLAAGLAGLLLGVV